MPKKEASKPVLWTNQAKSDLERIFNHIADHFTIALAIQITDEVIREVGSLSLFPRKGAISKQFNEIRELIVAENTIYYRNNEDDIVIAALRPRRTQIKAQKTGRK